MNFSSSIESVFGVDRNAEWGTIHGQLQEIATPTASAGCGREEETDKALADKCRVPLLACPAVPTFRWGVCFITCRVRSADLVG